MGHPVSRSPMRRPQWEGMGHPPNSSLLLNVKVRRTEYAWVSSNGGTGDKRRRQIWIGSVRRQISYRPLTWAASNPTPLPVVIIVHGAQNSPRTRQDLLGLILWQNARFCRELMTSMKG